MNEDLLRILGGSSLAALATIAIGCLILRDIVRASLYIFDSATRGVNPDDLPGSSSPDSSEKGEIQQ